LQLDCAVDNSQRIIFTRGCYGENGTAVISIPRIPDMIPKK
jgi:hypothetical protein